MSGTGPRLRKLARDGQLGLLMLACALLGITLARPTLPLTRHVYRFLIVLDITQSMNTRDYQLSDHPVSRLAFAKDALHRTLRELPCESQVGFGIFTAYRSFLLFEPVEICTNYGEVLASVDRADWRMGWAGNSEIAKGLHSALHLASNLQPHPALIFVTDGHEAPPVNPDFAPRFDGELGAVHGLIIGTGALKLQPIPKYDMEGHALGYWKPTEVMQTDVYSAGRKTSTGHIEEMAGSSRGSVRGGQEHLTSLKEPYLQQLARTLDLGYLRLSEPENLVGALHRPEFARAIRARTSVGELLGAFALATLVLLYLPSPRVWRVPTGPRPR